MAKSYFLISLIPENPSYPGNPTAGGPSSALFSSLSGTTPETSPGNVVLVGAAVVVSVELAVDSEGFVFDAAAFSSESAMMVKSSGSFSTQNWTMGGLRPAFIAIDGVAIIRQGDIEPQVYANKTRKPINLIQAQLYGRYCMKIERQGFAHHLFG